MPHLQSRAKDEMVEWQVFLNQGKHTPPTQTLATEISPINCPRRCIGNTNVYGHELIDNTTTNPGLKDKCRDGNRFSCRQHGDNTVHSDETSLLLPSSKWIQVDLATDSTQSDLLAHKTICFWAGHGQLGN